MANTAPAAPSAWAPLKQPIFRALWIASVVSNVGTLMQGVAAAWLMTSLTQSPLPVALLTTAGSLPLFLVGLPAGALADVVDRRWLVLVTQAWMMLVAAVLGLLTIPHMMTTWGLLGLTFLLGIGGALSAPAWQAIVPQLVGREDLAPAVALNGAGFNLARAVGPAIGGLLVAAAGPGAVFLLNAASFIGVIFVIRSWKPEPQERSGPAETVRSAVAAGMRYTTHSKPLRATLVRTAAFIVAASALWSLLPVVANHDLHLSALGYGVLLASLGLGAIGATSVLPRLRATLSIDRLVLIGTLIFAGGMLALAYVHNLLLLNGILLVVGFAWLTLTSCLNVATQTLSPQWVEARALGVYLLVFQGGFAAGSAIWGEVARRAGNQVALLSAAVVVVAGLVTALRWPLRTGEDLDLTPAPRWPEPQLAIEPAPEDGPVLVTIQYRIPNKQGDAFCSAMSEVQVLRHRDGALRWGLYHDAAAPDRYIETFEVATWAEYLRQRERITVADHETEEQALSFQYPDSAPVISHYIATCPPSTTLV